MRIYFSVPWSPNTKREDDVTGRLSRVDVADQNKWQPLHAAERLTLSPGPWRRYHQPAVSAVAGETHRRPAESATTVAPCNPPILRAPKGRPRTARRRPGDVQQRINQRRRAAGLSLAPASGPESSTKDNNGVERAKKQAIIAEPAANHPLFSYFLNSFSFIFLTFSLNSNFVQLIYHFLLM
jgi:hypothetical protein